MNEKNLSNIEKENLNEQEININSATNLNSEKIPSIASDNEKKPQSEATAATTTFQKKFDEITQIASGSLVLVVFNSGNKPIPDLELRVIDRKANDKSKEILFEGKTTKNGETPVIDNLPVGTNFEVRIKNDKGDYRFSAIGTIGIAAEHTGNIKIPRERFEFTSYVHNGTEGKTEHKIKELAKKNNQKPETEINISRNLKPAKPTITETRNNQGNPVAIISGRPPNMAGTNNFISAPTPNANASDLGKVKVLVEFARQQLGWLYENNKTSATIISEMVNGNFNPTTRGNDGMGYARTIGRCTKWVKIALWKAGYSTINSDFAPNTSYAREMGTELEKIGFKNITNSLPDARWAAAGDVIVYIKRATPDAAGHIDIRGYDGYYSDFYETYLPIPNYKVIGIYRKYSDLLPVHRMRAFLKVLRSREASTLFQTYGDAATYKALPNPGIKKKDAPMFSSFDTHPFAQEKSKSTPSGAYGVTLESWTKQLKTFKRVELNPNEPEFSPVVQDRIAVTLMEGTPAFDYKNNHGTNGLQLIRTGSIEEAVKVLRPQWSSLPGAAESRDYTLEQLMSDYKKYLQEYQNEK